MIALEREAINKLELKLIRDGIAAKTALGILYHPCH